MSSIMPHAEGGVGGLVRRSVCIRMNRNRSMGRDEHRPCAVPSASRFMAAAETVAVLLTVIAVSTAGLEKKQDMHTGVWPMYDYLNALVWHLPFMSHHVYCWS